MPYDVKINYENGEYIARDIQGSWRARCPAEREMHGRELVEHLFHKEEIGRVWSDLVSTFAVILDDCDPAPLPEPFAVGMGSPPNA